MKKVFPPLYYHKFQRKESVMTTITLKGALGKALARTVENRLKTVDYTLLEEPFVKRNEADNAWRCEFWGKTVRSAVYAAYFSGDADLRKKVDDTVGKIIASQVARLELGMNRFFGCDISRCKESVFKAN